MKNKIKNISICSLILSMFLGVGQSIVYAKEIGNEDTINKDSEVVSLEDNKEIEEINDETQLEEYESKEEKQKQDQEIEQKQEDPTLEKDQQDSLEEKANERGSETDNSKKLLKDSVFTSIQFVFTDDSDGNKVLKEIKNVNGGKISVLEIPDTYEGKNVVGIKPSATTNILEIETLIIPSIIINGGIFENKKIKDLTVYKSKHSLGKINDSAFKNNPLDNIDISGITYIGENAFWFSDADFAGAKDNVINSLVIDNSLNEFGNGNIFPKNIIKNLEIPSIDVRANIFNEKGIENLKINESAESKGELSNDAFKGNPFQYIRISGITKIGDRAFKYFGDKENYIKQVIVDDSLIELSSVEPFGFQYIKHLTIPSVNIPAETFHTMKMETLNIIKSSKVQGTIDEMAFIDNKLNSVKIAGIETINDFAFADNCIENLDFTENEELKYINEGAFFRNRKSFNLVLPKNLEVIGAHAFNSSNTTGTLVIPSKLERIEMYAFSNNKLTTIDFSHGDSLKFIGDHGFHENELRGSYNFPPSLEIIELLAFYKNSIDGDIKFSGNLHTIGRQAFAQNKIKHVDFKEAKKLEQIEFGAFHFNEISGELVFPESLKKIDEYAFYDNKINTLNISSSNNLEEIGVYAFRANAIESIKWPSNSNKTTGQRLTLKRASLSENLLRSVSVPESVIEIEENAFELNRLFQIQVKGNNTKVGPRAFAKQRSAWMNSIDIYSDNISVGATDAILAGSGTLKMYFDERALSNKNQDNVYLSNNPNGKAEDQHVEYVEIGKNVGQDYTRIGLENDMKNLSKVIFYDGNTDISGLTLPSNVDIVGFRSMGSNVKPFAKTSVNSDKNRLVLGSDDNTVNLVFKYTVDERQRTENPKAPEEGKNIRLVDRPISLTVKIDKIDNAEMQFKGVKLGDKLISAIQLTDKGSYYELVLPTGNYLGEDNTVTIEMDAVVDTESYVLNHKPINGYFKIDITPTIIASDDKGNIDEITGENEEVLITSSGVVFPPIGVKEYRETTFDANGGSFKNNLNEIIINSQRKHLIEKEEVEIPTRENHTFIEWNTKADQSGEKISYPYQVLKNETYYAIWKENKEEVSIGTVIVNYIDLEGNELEESLTLTGNVGDDYKTEEKVISGYTLEKTPENAMGVFSESETIVTYVYKLDEKNISKGTVLVKYIDSNGKDLQDPIILTGNVGETYKTEEKVISGYTLVKTPENAIGVFSETETIVTYVYNVENFTPHTGIAQSTVLQMIVLTSSLLVAYYLIKRKNKQYNR